ncbi:alpha/beta fold hydrolase [Rhodococcus sp. AG1013]|uniref:alpha/beta fold hydrolase n=1 Tax=unclassified Rhodococcus (in: high G+C Gram-positive bacteria) TaxID=192944 RepID=UPI000E0C3EB1|nr:alpha/beta hydrolase [Rhodococcus sp. AG1013]RDI34090.1 pimeloyl-ACP methyl ester carboxylesterase [Rhodococcus sp. AG1013]
MIVEMTETTVTRSGHTIAYRDSGATGSAVAHPVPVILVHGMGGDSRTWDRFARAVAGRGRRVLAVDLRGHGRSAHAESYLFGEFGDDILGLCEDLGFGSVDLVGHSLGGHAVSLVAQQRPDLVRRLVLEESPLPLRPGDPIPNFGGRLPSLVELWHAASSMLRSPRAVWAFDRSMTASALTQFHEPNPSWWQRLPDIEARTLILRGGPAGMVDPVLLDAAVTAIRDCEVVSFTSGHSIHRDRYRDFEAAVLPFLMAH